MRTPNHRDRSESKRMRNLCFSGAGFFTIAEIKSGTFRYTSPTSHRGSGTMLRAGQRYAFPLTMQSNTRGVNIRVK